MPQFFFMERLMFSRIARITRDTDKKRRKKSVCVCVEGGGGEKNIEKWACKEQLI